MNKGRALLASALFLEPKLKNLERRQCLTRGSVPEHGAVFKSGQLKSRT